MDSLRTMISIGCAWLFVMQAGALAAVCETPDYVRERMLGDLDFIKNTFQTSYALKEWKCDLHAWDLEAEIEAAKAKVSGAESFTTKQLQTVIKDFFLSARDYHACVEFYSTESATLPFIVHGANERFFFSYIDRSQGTSNDKFPFSEGDELLAIDGVPTITLINELIDKDIGHNLKSTDRALAQIYLTTRLGSLGHDVPSGTVTLTGVQKNSLEQISYTMAWDYVPEVINHLTTKKLPRMELAKSIKSRPSIKMLNKHPFFHKKCLFTHYAKVANARAADVDPIDMLGTKKSFIPPLGKILWESSSSDLFHAYIFQMRNGKRIGFVRIASYQLDSDDEAAAEFSDLVSRFQDRTDALVIDQLNNPGGLILYMYALLSMLTDRPLAVPHHRQMINQEDVFFSLSEIPDFEAVQSDSDARNLLGDSYVGITVNYACVKELLSHLHFIVDEWNDGRVFTQPGYLYGISSLQPHPKTRYTKPILLLVNAMDFSGGDFFPAILQDNGRAVVMGSRTAGAGGYVSTAIFPNLSGIAEFSFTASIAERPGKQIIENNGVRPDIEYELSVSDLQNNCNEYVQKILEAIDDLTFKK